MTATSPVHDGEAHAPRKPWPVRLRRLAKLMLIGNLALATLIAGGAVAAHKWATSSEERFEAAILFATRYVMVPASLVEDHGFTPAAIERAARLIESVVIDGAGKGPGNDAHRYFQARVLMAMPAVYKRLGRDAERVERAERGIALFRDLVARNPDKLDYRRRLAVTINMLADDLADMGRHGEAIAQRRHAMTVAGQLLERQPGHWRWRWYVAWAELGTAESLIATGAAGAAAPHLDTARTLSRALCREMPEEDRLCTLAARADNLHPA